jgi:hypothetical protein
MSIVSQLPPIGSAWQHTSGRTYFVLHIANIANDDRYPLTIVYRDGAGQVWTRLAVDWHRSMTLWPEPPP